MSWSPQQYLQFEDERTRPARDLLNALPEFNPRSAMDLGCGPGNSTALLAGRYPEARINGLDSSPEMIAAARVRLPQARFEVSAIESWTDPDPYDLILANAVLHWVPNHKELLPALVSKLSRPGVLAIQMPDNLAEPAHRLMREIAQAGPWAAKLSSAAAERTELLTVDEYERRLRPHCSHIEIWRTTYYHRMARGAADIVEWFKGSGLRPYLAPLNPEERASYLERYTAALGQIYPHDAEGGVRLPFPRLFIAVIRS